MAFEDSKTFQIEDARLLFRNFSGEPDIFNKQGGVRSFAAVLDARTANEMLADGWAVKFLDSREEGEDDTPYIQIAVKFKVRPPRITMITSTGRTILTEDTVGCLDYVDIAVADLIARSYDWTVGDKSGTKAYLQTLFVTINEDALERKYAQIVP